MNIHYPNANGESEVSQTNPFPVQQMGISVPDGQTLWTPGMLYNETTSDKPRGNTQGTLLALAARTSSLQTATQTNYNAKGIILFLVITAASGTGGLSILFRGIDNFGNAFSLNAAPTAITTATGGIYVLYPGASSVGNDVKQATSGILPRSWAIYVSAVDASSYTYSLAYSLII